MGRSRRKTRKERPPAELHAGYNYSRGRIPHVAGGAATDYSLASGTVRKRPWARHLSVFVVSFILVVSVVGYLIGGEIRDLLELLSATGSVGRWIVMLCGPLVLLAVMAYYYGSVGIEWPLETVFRLIMIGALLGLGLLTLAFALIRFDPTASGYEGFFLGAGAMLLVLAGIGYFGQRS